MAKKPNKIQNVFIKSFGIDRYIKQWELSQKIQNLKMFEKEGYELLQNKIWYDAKGEKIEHFYKTIFPYTMYQNQFQFWRVVNTNIPRSHYPLPNLISNSIGTLLFNQTPNFVVDAGSKARNKTLQARLNDILDVNDMLVLLQSAASYQSYSGQVGLKINYDATLADEPLFTIYPKENIRVHTKYGQTVYIDFIDNYEDDYKLVSRYGLGYINYMLFEKEKRVSLETLPETSGLQDVAFFEPNGDILPVIFASVVNNKGKDDSSDYNGLIDTFHALDEAYSALNNYIRRTKPHIFITEDVARKDASGKALPLNEFDNVITILDQAMGEGNTKIDRDIVDLKTEGYINTINKYRLIALEKIGLSPATIGIESGGANQSGEALNIRERASARLRQEKLANWGEQLDKFLYASLVFDYVVNNSDEQADGIYVVELPADFEVKSDFGEYIKQSLDEKSKTFIDLYEKGLISLEFAVKSIFGDEMSDEEMETMIEQIKNKPIATLNL